MSTSASLARLLQLKSDYNYYVLQQMFYSEKYDSVAAKVSKWQKADENWQSAFDECEGLEEGEKKKVNGEEYTYNEAEEYATAKVGYSQELIEERLEEYADLDIEYETMKEMYDNLITITKSEIDTTKQLVQRGAQDTGLLGGGGG